MVPVRSLTDGKRRLAPLLNPSERQKLNERFLSHTLRMTSTLSVRTLVVSNCPEVQKIARTFNVETLFEVTRGGLNPALWHASRIAKARGAVRVLVLPADLPFARIEDLKSLIAHAGRTGSAISPDRSRMGTNALCLPTFNSFQFRFGIGSFYLHQMEAKKNGLNMVVVQRPSLAFDIDLPADFSQLQLRENQNQQVIFALGLSQN